MITAPFNFIPLSEKVFFPPWAEDVSHDIPFEDGESGEIEITITAKSPIFIRDHEKREKFCNYNGTYFIPGSSIKGVVRSVLEIMSFAKFSKNHYNDSTYAVRDLSSAKNFYMQQMQKGVLCGWLRKTEDGYVIDNCGIAGRIKHEEIDKAFGIDFASHFQKDGFEKTSQFKYDIVGGTHKSITVSGPFYSQTNPKYDKREFYQFDPNGKRGTLVLTGQPTPRKNTGKMGDGKGFEFVFFDVKETLEVPKDVMEKFKFAYFDDRDTEPKESPDWTFWKEKLHNGEKVPVFFQKSKKTVLHFGLSMLYKLPYNYSVSHGVPIAHLKNDKDLAETIFGYVNKDSKDALKGRVFFSHAKAIDNAVELSPRSEILGTPRASYYPIYIRQNSEIYTTFMDEHFQIAGRKRYPVHKGSKVEKTTDTGNENVATTFQPLKEGVVFRGTIRYHNLKKVELGALLSALTFHNTPQTYHSIGLAKSLGYGKIEIALGGIEVQPYLEAFEMMMKTEIENWNESDQIRELLTMATEQNNKGNSMLRYMELDEFAKTKTNHDYLRLYSKLNGIQSVIAKNMVSKEDIERLQKEEEEKAKRVAFEKEFAKMQETQNIQALENFIQKYNDYEKISVLQEHLEMLKSKQQNDRFAKVNEQATRAYEEMLKKKGTKGFDKAKKNFLKKWEKEQNHKNSPEVLALVEKVKNIK